MSFWHALLSYGFLQHALAASLLAALACGVVGTFVVLKRIALLAGGIAHGVLAGMGLAFLLGFPPLAGAVMAAVAGLYPTLVATAFDEEFARLRGQPVELVRLLILILVALTVVLLIQVAGLILVIALLTLPAAMAWGSRSVAAMMVRATGWAALAGVVGLWLAYALDWPAGPTMVLATAALYVGREIAARRPASADFRMTDAR